MSHLLAAGIPVGVRLLRRQLQRVRRCLRARLRVRREVRSPQAPVRHSQRETCRTILPSGDAQFGGEDGAHYRGSHGDLLDIGRTVRALSFSEGIPRSTRKQNHFHDELATPLW